MGRPQFSQSGTNGGGQTVATQSRPEIVSVNIEETSNVASGSDEITEVYAPTSAIYNVQNVQVYIDPDADATTGDHELQFKPLGDFTVTKGKSNYNTRIWYVGSAWESADIDQQPTANEAQLPAVQSLQATENSPITLRYINNTDVAQENNRLIDLIVEEVGY